MNGYVSGICCLIVVCGLGRLESRGAEEGETVRLRATADVWVSDANAKERNTNSGKHSRLKLKTIQEMSLVRFDAQPAAGREVLSANLFLRRASDDKLRYVRVSTVNADWAEGESRVPYGPPDGATFLHADARTKRDWAWPGSSLADVIMTSGNSLACTTERKELDGGWISVPIGPWLVQALAAGDSDGLAIMDGGNPAYANNFIHGAQSRGSEPYIEVRLGGPLADTPQKPECTAEAAPRRAHLSSGAIRLSIGPAKNVSCWRITLDGRPVERWRVKHPAQNGPTVFCLEDLTPSKSCDLEVTAVSPGGKASPPARLSVTSSPALAKPPKLPPLEPPASGGVVPVEQGPIRVWAVPGLVKISPTTGRPVCDDLGTDDGDAAAPSARASAVWDGKAIGLFGARGEFVSYQLCIENIGADRLEAVRVRHGPLKGPAEKGATAGSSSSAKHEPRKDNAGQASSGTQIVGDGVSQRAAKNSAPGVIGIDSVDLYKNWYVRNKDDKWQPAYCIPLAPRHSLAIPDPERELPEQRNQTVYVDIHIPKDAKPGRYEGAVQVEADGGHKVRLPVAIEVFDFLLPDRLSFWPEMNSYRVPQRAHDYYRLAHEHRTVLNCWRWTPKLSGSGRDIRVIWDEYDRDVGPLLTGEAFKRNRRAGVPVECMYLPFIDNWPTPLSKKTYNYQGHWPGKGESIDHIVQHYLAAPFIGRALSDDYKAAFLAVQRQFIEHFRKMGYTRTEMQCFYGGKVTHRTDYGGNMWWTTDEPYHWDDWMALQYFCWLWTDGRTRAGGNARRWTARADISRPQWQGRVLDRIVDEVYYGAGGFNSPAMVRRCGILARDTGLDLRAYGGANGDTQSNTQSVTALLDAWTNGANAYLPWQTLGSDKALDEGDRGAYGGAALFVPGDRFQLPVVADMRLKAFRDGQQLIEYLVLLSRRQQLNREQIKAMLHAALPLDAIRAGARLDDADSTQFAALAPWQLAQLRRHLAKLIVQ